MRLLRPQRLVVAAFAIATLVHPKAGAAETTLLHRVHPTDVSWGEISFTQGPPVEIRVRKGPVMYPFSLKITCTERGRREHPDDPSGRPVIAPAKPRGAVYLAARPDGGREAWKVLVEELVERGSTLTPETFGTFVRDFASVLIGTDPALRGGFHGVTCQSVEGGSDRADELERVIEEGGSSTGRTGVSDARSVCAPLAGALDHESPQEILPTRFEVRAQREESLVLRALENSGARPAPWPDGAGIEYGKPPEGAAAYSSTGGREDGTTWTDELRPARTGGPSQTKEPYLLKSRAKPASIDRVSLDGDALMTRWIWRVRDVVLGTEPETSAKEDETLDVAFLFTEPHGPVGDDGYARAVARDFASSDEKPGLALLTRLLRSHLQELGPDAMLTVFCDTTGSDTAKYCVAGSCASVLNPVSFCGALAAKLD